MGVVRRDEDATGASFVFLNGRFDTKVAPEETGGAFCIFDSFRFEPGGPPLHVHANQDEWFLTEGGFEFQVGDTRARLGPGDSIHGPRGVPHCFASTTPTARMVVLFIPAGGCRTSSASAARRARCRRGSSPPCRPSTAWRWWGRRCAPVLTATTRR